jgi:phage FluMu protein Com
MKCPICPVLNKFGVSRQIFVKVTNVTKIREEGAALNIRTDSRGEDDNLFLSLCERA